MEAHVILHQPSHPAGEVRTSPPALQNLTAHLRALFIVAVVRKLPLPHGADARHAFGHIVKQRRPAIEKNRRRRFEDRQRVIPAIELMKFFLLWKAHQVRQLGEDGDFSVRPFFFDAAAFRGEATSHHEVEASSRVVRHHEAVHL